MNVMLELVDLVDKKGRIQKRAVPRHEAGQHQGLHLQIVIAIVVDKTGRLLVNRRAKEPNIGDYDHICGAIISGETPEEAAAREAFEETGVRPRNLRIVTHGVNQYDRYRYLILGEAGDEEPTGDPTEVLWVGYLHPDELRAGHTSGDLTFVDGFFEDIKHALMYDA